MADNVDDDGGEADGQEETQQLTFHHQVQAHNVRRLKNVKTFFSGIFCLFVCYWLNQHCKDAMLDMPFWSCQLQQQQQDERKSRKLYAVPNK